MAILYGTLGLVWMTIGMLIFAFPISIPLLLVFCWMRWMGRSATLTTPTPRSEWIPLLGLIPLLSFGAAFSQPPGGPYSGWTWPVFIALAGYAVLVVASWRIRKRSGKDPRVTGLLVLELWIGAVATWVVTTAVSPGSGLGAL